MNPYLNNLTMPKLGVLGMQNRECLIEGRRCKYRPVQQIYDETEEVLLNILKYLAGCVLTDETVPRLLHQEYCDLNAIPYSNRGLKPLKNSQSLNQNANGFLWDSNGRFGSFVRFQIFTDKCADEPTWDFAEEECKDSYLDCCP